MASPPKTVHRKSRTMIEPSPSLPESTKAQNLHLTPWALACLSTPYIQWGLLFSNPPTAAADAVGRLKTSLSSALRRFYPLAGRLRTDKSEDGSGIFVSVDTGLGEGAEFIHAIADNVTVADVANEEVLPFVRDFFPLNGAVGYDAHFLPLFAVQVTELADGMFLGCSFNHVIGDGTSFINFLKAWSTECRGQYNADTKIMISDDVYPAIKLPFSNPDDFIDRFSPPPSLHERVFRLSSKSISELKSRANDECKLDAGEISAFQALCALVWRSATRARGFPPERTTTCRILANNRPRLNPPLPDEYFACAAVFIHATATVSEIVGHGGFGRAAMAVHRTVAAHTDNAIRDRVKAWMEAPTVNRLSGLDLFGITVASSPRFDLYGQGEFGWGRAVAVRSGVASKYDGKVAMYMGREGRGSVDLEVSLVEEGMSKLLVDDEFMSVVST